MKPQDLLDRLAAGYDYDPMYGALCNERDQLQAENAKLRELVSGLEHCTQGLGCDCCPLYDPSGTDHLRCESLERELRIEVG